MFRATQMIATVLIWSTMVSAQTPPKVIFDTDMTGDCDDCGALAALHALADNGEVEILGCIASFGAVPYVAGCIDAINTYYGRGDLPIGAEQSDFGRPD
ncbi:MAG: nucleoside hydrolase, partial [Candidatus Omnitrophica bacterium]|nr:nucleoside hydrolase [Candidatus Omnitrophota bacterium]